LAVGTQHELDLVIRKIRMSNKRPPLRWPFWL